MGGVLRAAGHYLPPVVERLGVSRPIAEEPVGPSGLATRAAQAALGSVGLGAAEVDFIVFATMTPDVTFPGSGCYLQHQLGCGTVGALDIRAQCAGFLFALVIADRFVAAGNYRNVLVAGAEVHSAGLDYGPSGADVAPLYGDGAGVVLWSANGAGSVRAAALHSDGRHHQRFWCEYPASRQHPVRMTVENFDQGLHFPRIDATAVRASGADCLTAVIGEVLGSSGGAVESVDRFIVGHVFPDVAETAAARLKIPAAKLDVPSARHGHLGAAALPVALSEGLASGSLGRGATVCLAAAGAGYAWGAALIEL